MIELFPKRGEAGFSPNINFLATPMHDVIDRVVHGSDGPAGRVGSDRVTILPDFGGSGRVSTSDFLVFYWLFLGTWIAMNLRILHSDWLIFYDI